MIHRSLAVAGYNRTYGDVVKIQQA